MVYLDLLFILTVVNMGGLEDLILLMIFARAVLAGLVLSLLPLGAFAQGETTSTIVGQVTDATDAAIPDANPGRPTVSTPATLTPVGYLQFESGFTAAGDSPEFSSRYGFNEVM